MDLSLSFSKDSSWLLRRISKGFLLVSYSLQLIQMAIARNLSISVKYGLLSTILILGCLYIQIDHMEWQPNSPSSAILSWIGLFDLPSYPTSLSQLSDGSTFLSILSNLPKFKLLQEISLDTAQSSKMHYRIKNAKIIYDSLRFYYQTKLLKDTAKFNLSLSEFCLGTTKEVVKFVEFIIGAFVWSEGKKIFLEKILRLPLEHQETFMGIIKNAMNLSGDVEEGFGSPSRRAKNLLERIDELEEQNSLLSHKIQEQQVEILEKAEYIDEVSRSLSCMREDNQLLSDEITSLRSPERVEENTARLQFSIMEQKLSIQKNNYELRIKELEALLNENEEKLFQASKLRLSVKQLTEKNEVLTQNLESIQTQFDKGLVFLKEKDQLMARLRTKNQEYESRILKLQSQFQESQLRNNSSLVQGSNQKEQSALSTYRHQSNLREEMNSIIHELTLENSRLITEKVSKEQEYEEIILNQRAEIKMMKNQNKPLARKKRGDVGDSQGAENQPHLSNQLGIHLPKNEKCRQSQREKQTETPDDVIKVVQGLKSGHFEEVEVLVRIVEDLTAQLQKLKQERKQERAMKEYRTKELMRRANAIVL